MYCTIKRFIFIAFDKQQLEQFWIKKQFEQQTFIVKNIYKKTE